MIKKVSILLVSFGIIMVLLAVVFSRVSSYPSARALSVANARNICFAIAIYYRDIGQMPPLGGQLGDVLEGNNTRKVVFLSSGIARDAKGNYLDNQGRPFHFKIFNNQIIAFDSDQQQIASCPIK